MFIQTIKKKAKNGKVYESVVLMESYREGKKVKHRIIANLSKLPEDVIEALKKFLKGHTAFSIEELNLGNGKSFGAISVTMP